MKSMHALKVLGDLTASQWGMVTTAQAVVRGITRLQLSRLAEDGHLERIAYGIYRDTGAPSDRYDSLKAAWLSVDPRRTALERLSDKPLDAAVSGATASYLLGLGDLVPEPYEFTVSKRRQTQRTELTFRVRPLPPDALTRREGLPVTTPEQTIADLVEARLDLSLVTGVLSDTEALDSVKLAELLSPLAGRNGFERGDGGALLAELERLAHRDVDSLAKAVSSTPLAKRVAEEYLRGIDPEAVAQAMQTFRDSLAHIPTLDTEKFRQAFEDAMARLPIFQLVLDDRTRKQIINMTEQMRRSQRATTKAEPAKRYDEGQGAS
ncbi:MAG: type IV toxin-antitoxin system AbiEi family antitoxin domain-containing protein [Propionibacteriaceae bacterium]|nr:type IV toxin-antitoxin system AbiEi family antitoxin domain-containing protein [Propionibacteriaceae bacterium]